MDLLGLIGAVGGLGGLGWIYEKGAYLYRAPSLSACYSPTETGMTVPTQLRQTDEDSGTETRPMRWYHLQVPNTGRGNALGCTGTVEKLEVNRNGGWERHPTFVARIPLVWAHSNGKQERDIEPQDSPPWDSLDLFTVEPGKSLFHLRTPYAAGRGVQTTFRVNKTYRFTISVEDREGRSSAEAQVTVKPARNSDGELQEIPIEVSGQPEC